MPTHTVCAVPSCPNSTYTLSQKARELRYHCLPTDGRRRKWLTALGLKEETLTKDPRICSKHFSLESYLRTGKPYTLSKDAIPFIGQLTPLFSMVALKPATQSTSDSVAGVGIAQSPLSVLKASSCINKKKVSIRKVKKRSFEEVQLKCNVSRGLAIVSNNVCSSVKGVSVSLAGERKVKRSVEAVQLKCDVSKDVTPVLNNVCSNVKRVLVSHQFAGEEKVKKRSVEEVQLPIKCDISKDVNPVLNNVCSSVKRVLVSQKFAGEEKVKKRSVEEVQLKCNASRGLAIVSHNVCSSVKGVSVSLAGERKVKRRRVEEVQLPIKCDVSKDVTPVLNNVCSSVKRVLVSQTFAGEKKVEKRSVEEVQLKCDVSKDVTPVLNNVCSSVKGVSVSQKFAGEEKVKKRSVEEVQVKCNVSKEVTPVLNNVCSSVKRVSLSQGSAGKGQPVIISLPARDYALSPRQYKSAKSPKHTLSTRTALAQTNDNAHLLNSSNNDHDFLTPYDFLSIEMDPVNPMVESVPHTSLGLSDELSTPKKVKLSDTVHEGTDDGVDSFQYPDINDNQNGEMKSLNIVSASAPHSTFCV